MSNKIITFKQYIYPLLRKVVIFCFYACLLLAALYSQVLYDYIYSQKTLNVCAFTETFSPEAIALFEKRTGSKVNVTYVELDEQIFAKFKANRGLGYDIVNLSDFMVLRLAELDLLRELDHTKLICLKNIDDKFLNHAYDRDNRFSIPHKWFMYGIVYDRAFFNCGPDEMSLSLIFKNPKSLMKRNLVRAPYKICMLDSGQDSFFLAQRYLSFSDEQLDDDGYAKMCRLLKNQKRWVESYTLYTIEYFLFANIVPIAVSSSNFMRKILDKSDRFNFAVPQEGGILVVENLAVPKSSKKFELAQQFIDFMLSDEIAHINSSEYGWTSANRYANNQMNENYKKVPHLCPDNEVFNRLFIPLYPAQTRVKIDDIWLEVGFA